MLLWLEAQALANAEEGSPREDQANARSPGPEIQEDPDVGEASTEVEGESPDDSQRLITTFFEVRR